MFIKHSVVDPKSILPRCQECDGTGYVEIDKYRDKRWWDIQGDKTRCRKCRGKGHNPDFEIMY